MSRNGDPATPAAFLAVGDAVFQVLQESNVAVGPGYLGEVLELVRVPADGPPGETHRLLAAGELPRWSWLDAVRVGSDIVIGWIDGGERPFQLMRARP